MRPLERAFCLLMLTFACGLSVAPSVSLAQADAGDEDSMGYDAILDQLNREASRAQANASRAKMKPGHSNDPLDNVWIHAGIGISSLLQTVTFADGSNYYMNQRGIQAALGIDLFSQNWMAETTARSFGESEDVAVRSSVQEFELRLLYKDRIARRANFKLGLGLSGRYLTLKRQGEEATQYSTPTSVATAGLDMYLTDQVSVGVDFNGRYAMIGETLDHSSYDATFRIDTHF